MNQSVAVVALLILHLLAAVADSQESVAAKRIVTRWAADVDPAKPLPEYPRPQMVRERWQSLNGKWQYAIQDKDASQPTKWDGEIVVPFAAQSQLSGVNRRVDANQKLWYRRTFEIPRQWDGEPVQLHFGAVDWETTVWVNGREVGTHRGGYDPFTLDITAALSTDHEVEIIVSVWDPTDSGPQPRGKQTSSPSGIWYTPVTGIWQTVWLEPMPPRAIDNLKIVPNALDKSVRITADSKSAKPSDRVEISIVGVSLRGANEEPVTINAAGRANEPILLSLDDSAPRFWSPDEPWLYKFRVVLVEESSLTAWDQVESYFGLRTIERKKDAAGIERLFLNGRPLFHLGPLDQGWWPDGLYTAPTDAALRFDIAATKDLGFNAARKHVKVEPARWYYWADTLGLMVWQDMPSGMQNGEQGRSYVKNDGPDADLPEAARETYRGELLAIMAALRNQPSIVIWVPFNEGWGQHDTNAIIDLVKREDPTRLVDGPSGWADRGQGDLKDMHHYPAPDMFPVVSDRVSVLGEFGGLGLPLEGHTWLDRDNWGYRSYDSQEKLAAAYKELTDQLPALIKQGLSAAIYTQTTDVESEVNGLMTYDRAITKIPADQLRDWNRAVIKSLPSGPNTSQ